MSSVGTIGSKGNSPWARSRGKGRIMTVTGPWVAPPMPAADHHCLEFLVADMQQCNAKWEVLVTAAHCQNLSDDDAITKAFGELYNIQVRTKSAVPVATTTTILQA